MYETIEGEAPVYECIDGAEKVYESKEEISTEKIDLNHINIPAKPPSYSSLYTDG